MPTTSAVKFRPLNKQVLVREHVPATKTAGGVLLPERTRDHTHRRGKVLSVGPAVDISKVPVAIGQTVMYRRASGLEIDLDGEKFFLVLADDLLGVVED